MKKSNQSDESDIDSDAMGPNHTIASTVENSRIVESILQSLHKLKKPLNEAEICKLQNLFTTSKPTKDTKRKSIRDSLKKVSVLPKKNITAYMWSLFLSVQYAECKAEEYLAADILSDPKLCCRVITNMLKNLQDVCYKLNLNNQMFEEMTKKYDITVIVNNSVPVTSKVLKREPIIFVFTPDYTDTLVDLSLDDTWNEHDVCPQHSKYRKRKTFLLINQVILKNIFSRLCLENSQQCNYDAGVISVSGNNVTDQDTAIRQLLKLLMITLVHAVGHFDLFLRYSHCFYETHKRDSQITCLSSIFKKD
jgi:hypothetical protein